SCTMSPQHNSLPEFWPSRGVQAFYFFRQYITFGVAWIFPGKASVSVHFTHLPVNTHSTGSGSGSGSFSLASGRREKPVKIHSATSILHRTHLLLDCPVTAAMNMDEDNH
ncbi:hypothetical protein INR49_013826, partial [Caranx melampygus]